MIFSHSVSQTVKVMKITDFCHNSYWENLNNCWLTQYLFTPTVYCYIFSPLWVWNDSIQLSGADIMLMTEMFGGAKFCPNFKKSWKSKLWLNCLWNFSVNGKFKIDGSKCLGFFSSWTQCMGRTDELLKRAVLGMYLSDSCWIERATLQT